MDGHVILLQPLGSTLPPVMEERLLKGIPLAFNLPVEVAEVLTAPVWALSGTRNQYQGSALLRFLSTVEAPHALRLLGVLEGDAFAEGMNFIFGQATLHGRNAFIALARLNPTYYGQEPDPERCAERALREAVHELGHTFGLRHCANDCVMRFANSLYEVDVRAPTFCASCRAALDLQL
ncbi:MAG: archaemetzincin family Zn-dependent metalloprotease [Anaerolineales bacterium]